MNSPDPYKDRWLVFFLVAIAVFMSTLDSSIVNIALPVIMKDYQVDLSTIEWVVIIYLLTVSSLLLTFGRLSDIKGRRWVYCRGFIIFAIGSFMCGIASGPTWLISARSFQAIGAAMLMACSPALVIDRFPASERGRIMGILGAIVAAGLTTGPALGGIILEYFPWRAIFYVNIPIGLISAILAARILKDTKEGDLARTESFDWSGAVILIICLSTFITVLSHAYAWGYTSFLTLFFGLIAGVSTVFWVHIERKKKSPIFEPSLIKIRLFILPIISAIIIFAAIFIIIFLMPFYLVHPAGLTIDRAGYIMSIPFVILFFISPISGAISDKIGSRLLCTLGMIILTVALIALSGLEADTDIFSIVWRLCLVGIGIGVFVPPNSTTAMTAVPPVHRGIAAGTVATSRNLGMVIGIAIAGVVFNTIFRDLSGGSALKMYKPELEPFFMAAFQSTMLSGAVVSAVGIVVSYMRGTTSN